MNPSLYSPMLPASPNLARRFPGLSLLLLIPLIMALAGCDENVVYVEKEGPRMTLDYAWPRNGFPGDEIRVYGENFGDTSQLTATVGGVPARILLLTKTILFIEVPEGAGDGITIKRVSPGLSSSIPVDFNIIRSPYRLNRFDLAFTEMQAKTRWRDDDTSGVTRDEEFIDKMWLNLARTSGTTERSGLCRQVSSGDTVRVCYHDELTSIGPDPGMYTRSDGHTELMAVIDSTRNVFSYLRLGTSYNEVSQRSAVENVTSHIGRELVLRDIPYTRSADGSLVGSISGTAILAHVMKFDNVEVRNIVTATGNTNRVQRLIELLPTAESKIVITLSRDF